MPDDHDGSFTIPPVAENGLPINARQMTREMLLSANDSIEHQREGSTPAARFMSPSRVFASEGDSLSKFSGNMYI